VTQRTTVPGPRDSTASSLDGAFRLVAVMSLALMVLVVLAVVRGPAGGTGDGPGASASTDPVAYLYADPRPAPPLSLTAQDGSPFGGARLLGGTTLVFFGYTHCPDVCPVTVGLISEAMAASPGLRAVFVSVDPERDTVASLAEFVRYLPNGFTALTGTPADVRTAADAWGVRYAKVQTGTPGQYSMSHTAEVYVVDTVGRLRAHFPFGTTSAQMLATLRLVAIATPSAAPAASTPPPAAPTPSPTPGPAARMLVEVVSSSVWAGGASPVILALTGPAGRLTDLADPVTVQLTTRDGVPVGGAVRAVAVQPPGVADVSYVASVDIPSPGWWSLSVRIQAPGGALAGSTSVSALDPGATAALGRGAPTVRTPTLADVGGVALAVSTDPLPDLRLYQRSTTDALASGQPWMLVVDSARFKVSPACGKAIALAKFFLDRWPADTFIHLEPYEYDVVTDTAVLRGSLAAPTLVPAADAWGVGGEPWGAGSMPWVFIVDRRGVVRAKYQGVVGTDEVDVMLALLAAEG